MQDVRQQGGTFDIFNDVGQNLLKCCRSDSVGKKARPQDIMSNWVIFLKFIFMALDSWHSESECLVNYN